MSPDKERRDSARTEIRIELFVKKEDSEEMYTPMRAVDISSKGLRLRDKGLLSPGMRISVASYDNIDDESKSSAGRVARFDTLDIGPISGLVVWADGAHAGVLLEDLSAECREKIEMLTI
ncbi:PilZ domain-containing protein [Limisalsivibrio acetivorans]|uniref:PilZ domain-containing protein n=1 Tax=Limisalsivibrio acetivorans TaxID=1304888 RepID=UPI0003B41F6F|nr:PilZ domain-containing protein [Limisalsivibrio acetivorans]